MTVPDLELNPGCKVKWQQRLQGDAMIRVYDAGRFVI